MDQQNPQEQGQPAQKSIFMIVRLVILFSIILGGVFFAGLALYNKFLPVYEIREPVYVADDLCYIPPHCDYSNEGDEYKCLSDEQQKKQLQKLEEERLKPACKKKIDEDLRISAMSGQCVQAKKEYHRCVKIDSVWVKTSECNRAIDCPVDKNSNPYKCVNNKCLRTVGDIEDVEAEWRLE